MINNSHHHTSVTHYEQKVFDSHMMFKNKAAIWGNVLVFLKSFSSLSEKVY